VEFDRLKKRWFDPYRGSSGAVPYTGWPPIDVKAQITLDGDSPMPLGMSLYLLLGAQKVDDMRKTPGRLRFGWLHHENDLVGAESGTVATADTFIGENFHHPVGVTHNGISRRAILEARGAFTVATGDGNMHMGEARTRGALEAGLAVVGRRAGGNAIVAPDTFGLIDQQDISPFDHAMAAEVEHAVGLFWRFEDNDRFQIALLHLALHTLLQVGMPL
jgi:hypothetical protein